MRTAHPTPRLRNTTIGQHITLADAFDKRTFTVSSIREDGYYELSLNGTVKVIASPGHEIKETK